MLAPALALCAAATSAQSAQDATVLLTCGLGMSALTLAGVSVSDAVVFACCMRLGTKENSCRAIRVPPAHNARRAPIMENVGNRPFLAVWGFCRGACASKPPCTHYQTPKPYTRNGTRYPTSTSPRRDPLLSSALATQQAHLGGL